MAGIIICNKCRQKMDGVCLCTAKGNPKCLIRLKWRGRHYEFRRDDQGYVFTYDRARDTLIEINRRIKAGTFNPVDFSLEKLMERKFEQKIQAWLAQKERECASGEISPSSLSNIKGYVKNYYLPFFTGWDVREIQFEQIEAFKDRFPDAITGKTKANILVSLHAFFVWLRRKGVRSEVPMFPEAVKEDHSGERIALDYRDQQIHLAAIPEQHRDILEFGMETGIRPGELVALKVKDIDLEHQRVMIGRTVSAYSHILERTKGKSRKLIPLSDRAKDIAASRVPGRFPEEFLFVNPETGRRYSVRTPNDIWRVATGLSVTYYEASRHSFCTQIVDQGADVLQAKELMRHTDIRTTQRYYHGNTTKLREVVNRRARIVDLDRIDKTNKTKIEP